jgi:putative transposase
LALFRMIDQMRDIAEGARRATRSARRDGERRRHLGAAPTPGRAVPPAGLASDIQTDDTPPAMPFDQIEEW